MGAHLLIELVSEARHAAAHALILLCLRVPGCQQEGAEPLDLATLPMPGADDDQVQGVPQPLAVVPAKQRANMAFWKTLADDSQELLSMELYDSVAQLWWQPLCTSQADSMESQVQALQLESLQAAAGGGLKQQAQRLVLTGPGSQQTHAVGPGKEDLQALRRTLALNKFTLQLSMDHSAAVFAPEGLQTCEALLPGQTADPMPNMRPS